MHLLTAFFAAVASISLTALAILAVIVFILICVFFPKKPHPPRDYSNRQDTIDRLP